MKLKMKINWKKFFRVTLWVLIGITFIVSVSFSDSKRSEMLCSEVQIFLMDTMGHSFVERNDIEEIITGKFGNPQGKPLHSINISLLEKIINNNPFVSTAQVFSTIDGKLVIEVEQRNPVVRIINNNNESFYMDDEGVFMPLSDNYTARVPVANGNIFNRETEHKIRNVSDVLNSDTSFHATMPENIFRITDYIHHHEFWNAQIVQMYVNADGEFELVPLVGNQIIIFGDAVDIDEKFEKLFTFYKEGLNKTGWNQYASINLKFKDQVVCTKK
jgi:cell division protein FtsQ